MQGDKEIIALLNEQLTSELTAINQYFLHAKMQENWGYTKLASHTRYESIDEMKHAEKLTDRILFLEGLPNYQKLFTLHVGQTVKEQLQSDLDLELGVVKRLKPGIALMRERGDIVSALLFEEILKDEEHHIDYLETELALMETLGEALYLQRYAEPPSED
ncbi:bacterioferritin [Streptosporangiaceae bacterium NEAU-GS5]|nr:bacterioferritin [Streptosporangiaceae bacterium NEAU-GS5]